MSTTNQVYPASATTVAETPWDDNTWSNPTNVYSDDGNNASVTAASFDFTDVTYVLKAYNFNFSAIPDGSTINGVTCRFNAWYANGSGSVNLCQLLDTSLAKVGTNQCETPVALTTNNATVITKGSSSDLWGNELTAAWVKNSNFGVALGCVATANDCDVFIDYVTLEIEYTAGGASYERQPTPDGMLFGEDAPQKILLKGVPVDGLQFFDPVSKTLEKHPVFDALLLDDVGTPEVEQGAAVHVQVSWLEFDVMSGAVTKTLVDGIQLYDMDVRDRHALVLTKMLLSDSRHTLIDRVLTDRLLVPTLITKALELARTDPLFLYDTDEEDITGPLLPYLIEKIDGLFMGDGVLRGIDATTGDRILIDDSAQIAEFRTAVVVKCYPMADLVNDGWASTTGNLWDALNDEGDSDFIQTSTGGESKVQLLRMPDPGVDSGHHVVIKGLYYTGSSGIFNCILHCGDTLIRSEIITLTATEKTHIMSLSEAEAANITDYNDMRITMWRILGSPRVNSLSFNVSKYVTDSLVLVLTTGEQVLLDSETTVDITRAILLRAESDGVLFSDIVGKVIERTLRDKTLLDDSDILIETIKAGMDLILSDGVMLADIFSRSASLSFKQSDSLFLSDFKVFELLRSLRDSVRVSDSLYRHFDIASLNSVLIGELLYRMFDIVSRNEVLLLDSARLDWEGVLMEFLVYARLDAIDPLGIYQQFDVGCTNAAVITADSTTTVDSGEVTADAGLNQCAGLGSADVLGRKIDSDGVLAIELGNNKWRVEV